ncbi:MAG: hypothetical protein PVG91_05085 [Gammaproteobacteria bacterium]
MRIVWLCALMALSIQPATAQAAGETQIVACHGCSESRARLTAEARIPRSWGAGVYDVYVVDTPGGRLRRYRVTSEFEGRLWEKYAMARTPSSSYRNWFNQGRSEWLYVKNAAKPGVVLGDDIPVRSAEEVLGSAINQTIVSEQINRNIPARIGSLFGAALRMLRTIFTDEIFIEVGFADGSTALFVLDRINSPTSGHMFVYVYKPGSARDSEGNAIPDSAAALDPYSGVFSSEYNFEIFRRRAQMYGADGLDAIRNFEPRALPAHVVCAWGDGATVKCWRR